MNTKCETARPERACLEDYCQKCHWRKGKSDIEQTEDCLAHNAPAEKKPLLRLPGETIDWADT